MQLSDVDGTKTAFVHVKLVLQGRSLGLQFADDRLDGGHCACVYVRDARLYAGGRRDAAGVILEQYGYRGMDRARLI